MPHVETAIYSFGEIETALSKATSRWSLFEEHSFKKAFFKHLNSLLSDDDVLSVDIFDTLLLRDNSSELSRFMEIGEIMSSLIDGRKRIVEPRAAMDLANISKLGIDAFLARYLGTKATYRARDRVEGYGEGSLTEIHRVASRLLTGSDGFCDKFIDAEISYEATRVQPNHLLLDYIEHHVMRGGSVILVTDMYMHAPQVEALLRSVGIDVGIFSLIISSADTCVSKASGLIFKEIETRLGRSANHFLHVGDSLKGDFRQPMAMGWRALHLPISKEDISQRRSDHISSEAILKERFSITTDIAIPA